MGRARAAARRQRAGAALTMRILDLTTTAAEDGAPRGRHRSATGGPAGAGVGSDPHDVWAPPLRYRRPA